MKVESLEKVPTDFHGLYKKADDGFVLDAESPSVKSAVAAITRLNTALKASRAEAKAKKSVDLTPLAEFGDSPEAISINFKQKLEEAQIAAKATGNQDLARQIEKIKADLGKTHGLELQTREKRIEALTGQLYQRMVRNEALTALAGAGVIDPDLALPFIEKQVKVEEKDGQFSVTVRDEAGDVRYSGATGQQLTIRELVEGMKADKKYGPLFKSEAASGPGTPPGSPSRSTSTKKVPTEMSSVEKISAGLRKGQHQSGKAAASR